jgi:DNA-binding MarR family transcriptional regulator
MTQSTQNQHIGSILHKVVFLIDRIANRALQKEASLTLSQFLILLSLDKTAQLPLSQQTIAGHLGIDKAAVSRQVTALVKKGFVMRMPHRTSRRAYELTLSQNGLQALRVAQAVMLRTMTNHYQHVHRQTLQDLQALQRSLEAQDTHS